MLERLEQHIEEEKILIHFMQPHAPFLLNDRYYRKLPYIKKPGDIFVWDIARQKRNKLDIVVWGYYKNLKIMLPYIRTLLKMREGRTIISSDHGNMLEGKKIGHGKGWPKENQIVPWFIVGG